MTEADWNRYTAPQPLWDFLRAAGKLSERKARLFMVALCRRIWPLLTDGRSRRAVELAEQLADGQATPEREEVYREAHVARLEAAVAAGWYAPTHGTEAQRRVLAAVTEADRNALTAADAAVQTLEENLVDAEGAVDDLLADTATDPQAERAAQAALLRCLFGSVPFRTVPLLDISLLTWNRATIQTLAEATYQNRLLPSGELEADRLTVLADAVEDAGAVDTELVGHLRSPGPHVRGCFAVDGLLGKS